MFSASHKCKIFLFVISMFLVVFGQSSARKINGIVVDTETELPLIGVNIFVPGSQIGTTSDQDGYFEITVPEDAKFLQFEYVGYAPYKLNLQETKSTEHLFIKMQPTELTIDPVIVTGTRANKITSPTPFTQINQEYIQENYGTKDVPMVLLDIPGVYSYSDNGTGMGYTYLNIRGFDSKRISVMINGVPHNDPEDHTVYWVDMPDLLESASTIQVQKGVGISPYAISSFGGSVNLFTTGIPLESKSGLTFAYGSYNTQKYNTILNKKIKKDWFLSFRLSHLKTDGYRERSGVDLWSYYFKLIKTGDNSYHQWNVYGGQEITHAAWEYSPQSILEINHRHNPITYHNYIDNFKQPHYEYIFMKNLSSQLILKNTLFYIHGIGYYENLKRDQDFYEYGLVPSDTMNITGDLIRQKWVAKDQAGIVTQLDYKLNDKISFQGGTYLSYYSSKNWGEVKEYSTSFTLPESVSDFVYYKYTHKKSYLNFFLASQIQLTNNLSATANLYSQNITFKFKHGFAGNFTGMNRHAYDLNYNYLLPKLGLVYKTSPKSNIYFSISKSQREPTANELFNAWYGPDDLGIAPYFSSSDTIYKNGVVDYIKWKGPKIKDEKLLDLEIGYRYLSPQWNFELNAYRMYFDDEIVLYSAIDEDGFPIKGNADKTIHEGIELSTNYKFKNYILDFNLSYAHNYFKNFKQEIYIQDSVASINDFSGNTISGFPDLLSNFSITAMYDIFKFKLTYRYRGRIYLDNSQNKSRSIDPLNNLLDFSLTIKPKKKLLLAAEPLIVLQINNLLNTKYYTAGYYDNWYQENYLIPAATRNVLLTFKFFF